MRYRNLILFRTHVYNDFIDETVGLIREDGKYDLLVMCDESNRQLPVRSDVRKYSLSPAVYQEQRLYTPHDVMWRCGDYVAYTGAAEYPDAPVIWMMEHDVLLNYPDPINFFAHFDQVLAGVDFAGIYISEAKSDWQWTRCMSSIVKTPQACLFPLTRFSKRAIDCLRAKRSALSVEFQARVDTGEDRKVVDADWPNDEVFCASIMADSGYKIADFNQFGEKVYDKHSFGFLVHSPAWLRTRSADKLVYHPVNSGNEFLKRVRARFAGMVTRGRSVDDIAAALDAGTRSSMDLECGPGTAEEFLMQISWECAVRDQPELTGKLDVHLHGEIVQLSSGGKLSFFFLLTSEDEIAKELRIGRFYDRISLAIIKRLFPKGGVFVDVGAHIGNQTIFVANFLSPLKIIAVEPNPGLMPILKMNCAINKVDCELSYFKYAFSNREGDEDLQFDPRDTGLRSPDRVVKKVRTRLVAGDSALAGERVDFIKIDTGGYDLEALEGLQKTVHRSRVPILINVHQRQHERMKELVNTLDYDIEMRYRIHWDCENWLLRPHL